MLASLVVAAVLSAPAADPAPAAPRYYFILFGGQSVPFKPNTSHTFATFVKATPAADGAVSLEPLTISWLPAEGPVKPLRVRSSEGKNYSLEETFAITARDKARISMWGPFETDATRYALAVAQVAALNSGTVRFRSFDSLGRNRSVQHCAHAVTFADPNLQWLRQPVLRVGEPGTSRLATKYATSGALVSTETHDWLIPALGLDKVGVVRRELGEYVPRQWR